MYVHIRIKKKTYSRTLLSKIRCNNKQQDIYYKNCRGKYLPCNKYMWKVKFIVNTLLYPIYHWTSLKTVVRKNISCHLWKHSLMSIFVKAWGNYSLFKMKIKLFIAIDHEFYCLISYLVIKLNIYFFQWGQL